MKPLYQRLLVLLVLVTVTLAFGCAKKPVSDDGMAGGPAADTGGTGQDSSFSSQSVSDSAAPQVPASLQRIHFDFDSYVLSPESKATLQDNADYLKAYTGKRVQIEGHCDERGSDEYNLVLGEKRARATKAYLVSLGIDDRRIDVISFGEERPLDPASNENAWAKNRRAEFVGR